MTETNNNSSAVKPQVNTDRLKRNLLLLLAVLPGLGILSLLLFTNMNDERILGQQAHVLLKNTSSESITHTESFLRTVEDQLLFTASIFEQNIVSKNDHLALENLLIAQLEIHSNIVGLYTTNRQGDFYHVSRSGDLSKAKYRVKSIDKTPQESISHIWWRDVGSSKIQETILPDDDYDPRTRTWYKDVLAKKTAIWTEPYVFFTSKQLGVTTAAPVRVGDGSNDIYGVVGADVELTELVNLLDKLEISRFGSTFITTDEGILIAGANMHEMQSTVDNKKLELLNINNSGNTSAKMAYKAVFTDNKATFILDGKEFLVESLPLKVSDYANWRIVSFAEKDAFLSEIRNRSNQQYILAGLVTVLSILLGWFLAKTAWKPLDVLEDNANFDQLTKLYNRRFLDNRARELIKTAIQQDQPLCVAILDIDKFKSINDTYGHAIGDLVIQIFANRLRNQNRPLDLLARFGGEEFVLVMPNTTLEVAQAHINNSRITMKDRAYIANEFSLKVTFSTGIAKLDSGNNTYKKILNSADKALYTSKNTGRDKVSIV